MKIISTIARYLLGLLFIVFGLNGFLNFIPGSPPPTPLATQFLSIMATSHYMVLVFVVQLLSGVLLLAGFYVPLALTFLGPVLVNILNYHVLMDPRGIGPGAFATILWILVFISVRSNFDGLLRPRPERTNA